MVGYALTRYFAAVVVSTSALTFAMVNFREYWMNWEST
jgi:hypothetical protein